MRLRFLLVASGVAMAAAGAFASDITVSGPQGHSIAVPAGILGSAQPAISYWQYKKQAHIARRSRAASQASGGFRYGRGLEYWRGVHRPANYYRNREYSRQRFDNLSAPTHRGRFGGPPGPFTSRIRYTNSFARRPMRYASTIRYGFR